MPGEEVLVRLRAGLGGEGSAWLAESVERVTLDRGVVGSSPTVDTEIT